MNKNIWLGLVKVKAINGNTDLGKSIGAFVNVAYRALNKKHFIVVATESFKFYDFKVIEIKDEDIEMEGNLSIIDPGNAEKLILLARVVDGDEFAWGTFHGYLKEE